MAIIGPDLIHRHSLQAMLSGHVERLTVLPESYSVVRADLSGRRAEVRRRFDELTRTRHRGYLDLVLTALDTAGTEVVVAYWGTLPIPDLIALRRARPRLRLVLMVLCHPMAVTASGVLRQQLRMAQAARVVDGFVVPTRAMAQWFGTRLPTRRRPPAAVVRPCWPASLSPAVQPEPWGCTPNVVYIGRPDVHGATAMALDDVRPQLRALLEAGIEVHHGSSPELDDGHPLRRPFPPTPVVDLVGRIARHDASVVTYALATGDRSHRFALSVPDRLISSCAAGVPVALPAPGYEGSAEYLEDYGAILRYRDAPDLAAQLGDRDRVAELQTRAWAARTAYTAESHGEALRTFLAGLG